MVLSQISNVGPRLHAEPRGVAPLAADRVARSGAVAPTDHELTVVIPAYNEQARLPRSLRVLAEFLATTGIDYRVLVADDGSRDATPHLTAGLGPRFSTVSLGRHAGKGSAVRNAMLLATGQVVGFTDADLPYELTALAQGYDWIREDRCEVALGHRTNTALAVERRPTRIMASRAFHAAVKRLVCNDRIDTQCGLKLFSRRAAVEIFSRAKVDGFAFDAEVVMLAMRLGLSYRRLPATLVNDQGSTVSIVRDALPMLWDVVKARLRLRNVALVPRFHQGWGRLPQQGSTRAA
jgi:dolichyl-phosphate beta-glucosyltransferase